MEFDGTLKHLPFFEALASMDENDAAWRTVAAGLVTLRLLDARVEDPPSQVGADAWRVIAVRQAVSEISESSQTKRILESVVEALSSSTELRSAFPRLMAYGSTLEYDAKWALAADVYETIVRLAHADEDADLLVGAHIQSAVCRRTLGDFDAAEVAYRRAGDTARAAGNVPGVLRARLGDAKIAMARGNIPQAEAILAETIARATVPGADGVRGSALTDRAFIAGNRGDYQLAIRFSYEALEFSNTEAERDRALNNIATGFRYLGLPDVARDAYLVLAATAQEQYMRWMAGINLMELAAEQQIELQFDKYRREIVSEGFTPYLTVTYLLAVGRGYHALGKPHEGIPYFEQAINLASQHRLNQLLFEAESALVEARRGARRLERLANHAAEAEVMDVVDAIREMKRAAGIT